MKKLLLSAMLAAFAMHANADEKSIREQLGKAMPNIPIDTVKPSVVKGIYEVNIGSDLV
ncbi:MAG: Disulfide bond isomerase protein N-terminus, partial [Pseudomonadota bacterium]